MIVGGGGLIGSHTVDELLKTDVADIIVYTRLGSSLRNIKLALRDRRVRVLVAGDNPLSLGCLERAFEKADGVFHMAAMWLPHCREHPTDAIEVNIRGTFNVARACLAQGVSRLAFSSSAAAYAEVSDGLLTEDVTLEATNLYGATKASGEALLRAFHHEHGLDYVALRYMNVYGPRQVYIGPHASVIMKMLGAIDRGEPLTVTGVGADAFDFIAVEDCARANVKAMRASSTNRAYNVCTGTPTTLLQLAELLTELTGAKTSVKFAPTPEGTSVRSRVGSPKRAATELGFTASIGLRDGLKRLIEWRAAQRANSFHPAKC